MEINPSINTSEQILPIVPQRWHYRLAEWVSRLFSPPLVASVALLATTLTADNRSTLSWVLIAMGLMILAPAGYLTYLHRRGQITDLDVYVRQQRIRPYLFSITCSLLTLSLLHFLQAPPILKIIAAAAVLETSGLFLVNLKWKISAHTAAIAGFSSLGFWTLGSSALPLIGLVPLVAWSRVHIKRHTLAQTIAGSLWGIVSFTLAFWLVQ